MVEGLKEHSQSFTMAEIARLEGQHIVNQPMLLVPPDVVSRAKELQTDTKQALEYLENCYLIYRDSTLNHVRSGIPLQFKDGSYQWLTPAYIRGGCFKWYDIDLISSIAQEVVIREQDKTYRKAPNSAEVYNLAGDFLYWQKLPVLDRKITFFVPSRLVFADAMDWTQDTASKLYRPVLEIKRNLIGGFSTNTDCCQQLTSLLEIIREPIRN